MFNPSQCRLRVSERSASRMSSPVTGSILDIFTLWGFEKRWINKRCKVVAKCNVLSFLNLSVIFPIGVWI